MPATTLSPSLSWEPPSPEDLQRQLPQYEFSGLLGRGGMGAVYKGRQPMLDRQVAIKVLPEAFTQAKEKTDFARRFKQEAQALAGLDHRAIVSVHDFGETAKGQLYFVMEFVDGMDLRHYLHTAGGKLPQERALTIVAQVLDGLDYAHARGIVHRDIKPANILLNREGRVKIADFGLAKRSNLIGGDSAPAPTVSRVVVGSPDFVAPESLDSKTDPDHRADLYAVGVMLYQLLTGRIPRGSFKAPSEVVPGLDPRLDAVVVRATQSDPEDRYASASAVRADLEAILSRPLAKAKAMEASAAADSDSLKRERDQPKPRLALVYGGVALAAALGVVLTVLAIRGVVEPAGSASVPSAPPGTGAATDDPRRASTEQPFENHLGMKFVPVPGTEVLFCIHETRYRDYAAYAAEAEGVGEAWRTQSSIPKDRLKDHPVVRVSWEDAQAFCAWLSEKERRTYRLPTDREWSVAAGLGGLERPTSADTPETLSGRIAGHYPWGREWPPPTGAGNFGDESQRKRISKANALYLEGYDDGFPTTAPVMSFAPNEQGLFDLGGNVWEWCEDWYNEAQDARVMRGVSFYGHARVTLRSSYRLAAAPASRIDDRGFRVVLVADGESKVARASARVRQTVGE